ncbi:hypothetical protein [Treponema sp.]|uniref:hypothetical protein n=1 Tax=Treponema sp. TaxID=166 RepID=UPI003F0E1867
MKKIIFLLLAFSACAFVFSEENSDEGNVDKVAKKLKEIGQSIEVEVKSASEKTEKAINNTEKIKVSGVLKVEDLSTQSYVLSTDRGTFTLHTITQSENSLEKLSKYKDKNILVSGILNKETNVITMTSYKEQ